MAALLVVLSAVACSRDDSLHLPPPKAYEVPPATAPDSSLIPDALSALETFLDASREGSSTRDALPSLTDCPSGGGAAPGPMLATYRLLPAAGRADTIVGRALVTTVAEQDVDRQHPGYFTARVRIRTDTLEWDLLRTERGVWTVCNGLQFGMTAPDSLTTWRPGGASAARARALADSLAAVP